MTRSMFALYMQRALLSNLLLFVFFALLGLIALISGVWMALRSLRPLDKPAYARTLRGLRMQKLVAEDEVPRWEDMDRLRRYQRSLGAASFIGMGIGMVVGAVLGGYVNWALYRISPYFMVNLLESDAFWLALTTAGMACGSAIGLVVGAWRLSRTAFAEMNAEEADLTNDVLPRRIYLPNILLAALGGIVALCLIFLALVGFGALHEQVFFFETGLGEASTAAPHWLLIAQPLMIIALVSLGIAVAHMVAQQPWPAPAGVEPTLARRVRRGRWLHLARSAVVVTVIGGGFLTLSSGLLVDFGALTWLGVSWRLPILRCGSPRSCLRCPYRSAISHGSKEVQGRSMRQRQRNCTLAVVCL